MNYKSVLANTNDNEDECAKDANNEDVNDNVDPFHASSDEDPENVLSENEEFTYNIQRNRKKRKHPELWKQNSRKQKRNSGQKYINYKNKEVRERKSSEPCNNCVYKCLNSNDREGRDKWITL
ncbi:hypothetical protein ILUMI_07803 [Ignelater luminosus]|uniref:Uncharacterized protein n=1 Tax=Ignelater luminosus TaxID=2038154 RepID=A0A8K0D8P3_IGNLU|nr:hypothetical protein ILUMI_07803 [Ignelater luminosus]